MTDNIQALNQPPPHPDTDKLGLQDTASAAPPRRFTIVQLASGWRVEQAFALTRTGRERRDGWDVFHGTVRHKRVATKALAIKIAHWYAPAVNETPIATVMPAQVLP